MTSYCGSLFLGHCTANDLLDHFYEFMSKLGLVLKNLLNIGMDGPSVNKSFLKKLRKDLQEKHCTCFIDIGTCPLHIVNNSFAKGINSLKSVIDLDRFAIDLRFFFSLSSARREDFQGMSEITDVTVHYLLKHCCARWLSTDKVLVRIIEQCDNIKEYFLFFCPSKMNLKEVLGLDQQIVIRELNQC